MPKNIDEIKSVFFTKCLEEDIFKKLNLIKKNFSKEWNSLPESIKKNHLVELSINLTYNTNAIEGSKITKEESDNIIRKRISPNKSLDDIYESIAHSKVFFDVIQDKNVLSQKQLLSWHDKLFKETKGDIAGVFRDYSVKVGDYRAPDWQDLNKLIKEYFEWFNKNRKIMHPIELSARMHYRFEKIHPFGDGNGRIGRLILVHILFSSNFPVLVIENKKKKSYYLALEKGENAFVQYFIRRYLSAFKEYL